MPLLTVKHVQFDVRISNDSGSHAKKDLSIWKPQLEDGWYYLGPAANNGDPSGCLGVVVKPSPGAKVLAPITEWKMVWNDSGSGKQTDFALWHGLPSLADRAHFIVIGGFFTRSHQPPTKEDTKGMMAIHKDMLATVRPGKEIWNDMGTGARQDGAVWEILIDGFLHTISTGAFVPVDGYNNPPRGTYALDRYKVFALMDLSQFPRVRHWCQLTPVMGNTWSALAYTRVDIAALNDKESGTNSGLSLYGLGIGDMVFNGLMGFESWDLLKSYPNDCYIARDDEEVGGILVYLSVKGDPAAIVAAKSATGQGLDLVIGLNGTFTWNLNCMNRGQIAFDHHNHAWSSHGRCMSMSGPSVSMNGSCMGCMAHSLAFHHPIAQPTATICGHACPRCHERTAQ